MSSLVRSTSLAIPKRLRVHTRFDRGVVGKLSSGAWTCLKEEVRRLLGRDDVVSSMTDVMTPEERRDPHKIDAIRMQHLSSELEVRTGEIIGLIRQFDSMSGMMQIKATGSPPRLPVTGVLVRNQFLILVVLFHRFRRLGPPFGPRHRGPQVSD